MIKLMKKAMLLAVMSLVFSAPSYAYVVDGLLSDWGVTPFVNWTPSSTTADMHTEANENNYGGPGNSYSLGSFGGEQYDAEAFYFDDDPLNVYFALVTSFPQAGVNSGSEHIDTGDIAIALYGSAYNYGISLQPGTLGNLYLNPTWSLPDGGIGFPVNAPSNLSGGTFLSTVSVVYNNTGIIENGFTTYVVEGSIAKSLLGSPLAGESIKLHWTESCGNDLVEIVGDIDNPVPEPMTLSLLGLGLAGFAFKKRKSLAA